MNLDYFPESLGSSESSTGWPSGRDRGSGLAAVTEGAEMAEVEKRTFLDFVLVRSMKAPVCPRDSVCQLVPELQPW